MPRRGENIYKRKDGRWEGRISKPDGKYKYVYAKTYKEVKEKKKNCQDNIKSYETPKQIKNASELFEYWLSNDVFNQVKPTTYGNYYCSMKKYIIPFFKKSGNERITELSVAKFVKTIKDNNLISDTYKRKILVIFKTALKKILKESADYLPILDVIKLPKIETAPVQVFSIREQRLIENTVLQLDKIDAYGIILCFYTGIRLGELCALKWSDIDFESGIMSISKTVARTKNFKKGENKTVLLVGTPKSNKSIRKIPLPDFILKYYAKYKTYNINEFNENNYILSKSGTPVDPRTIEKLYKKIIINSGVKYRKFHAIRHTFATRALELGVDIKTLSEILGHASVSITLNIYAHSLIEQKKIAIDKFNHMHIAYMEPVSFAVTDTVNSV